jgi:hypothetical protein
MKIPTKPPPYVVGPGCPKDLVADFTALCRCQLVAWTGHGGTMGEPWGNHGGTMGKPWNFKLWLYHHFKMQVSWENHRKII